MQKFKIIFGCLLIFYMQFFSASAQFPALVYPDSIFKSSIEAYEENNLSGSLSFYQFLDLSSPDRVKFWTDFFCITTIFLQALKYYNLSSTIPANHPVWNEILSLRNPALIAAMIRVVVNDSPIVNSSYFKNPNLARYNVFKPFLVDNQRGFFFYHLAKNFLLRPLFSTFYVTLFLSDVRDVYSGMELFFEPTRALERPRLYGRHAGLVDAVGYGVFMSLLEIFSTAVLFDKDIRGVPEETTQTVLNALFMISAVSFLYALLG